MEEAEDSFIGAGECPEPTPNLFPTSKILVHKYFSVINIFKSDESDECEQLVLC